MVSGCSTWKETTPAAGTPDEIDTLLSIITRQNEGLKTIKGISKARVTNDGVTRPMRIAWIASRPDKVRFELLGIPGQSSATLSFDGDYYYFISSGKEAIVKGAPDDSIIESTISVPVNTKDVIDILAGKVPVIDFDRADINHSDKGDNIILTLEQDWFGKSQKIYYDPVEAAVKKTEIFSFTGTLEYAVRFERVTRVDNFLLPFIFSLSSDSGASFRWETERCYANVPISPHVFELAPNEKRE